MYEYCLDLEDVQLSLIGSGLYLNTLGGIEPLKIYVRQGTYYVQEKTLLIDSGILDYIGGLVRGPAHISNFDIQLRDTDLYMSGISCVTIPILGYQCRHIDISTAYSIQMTRTSLLSLIERQIIEYHPIE